MEDQNQGLPAINYKAAEMVKNIITNDPAIVQFQFFLQKHQSDVYIKHKGNPPPPEYFQGLVDCLHALNALELLNREAMDGMIIANAEIIPS